MWLTGHPNYTTFASHCQVNVASKPRLLCPREANAIVLPFSHDVLTDVCFGARIGLTNCPPDRLVLPKGRYREPTTIV